MQIMRHQKRSELRPGPRTYQMTNDALGGLDKLCLALDLPKVKVLELAVLHLLQEWESGKLRGIALEFENHHGAAR